MHSGVCDLVGGDKRHTGNSTIQPVQGSAHRRVAHQQHGQDNDSGERGDLRHGRDSGDSVRGGEPSTVAQAAHAGGARGER